MKRSTYIVIIGLLAILMLLITFYNYKSIQKSTQSEVMVILENQSQFSYDEFIDDSETRENILRVVEEYVDETVKANGHLVFRGDLSNRIRQFEVIKVFDVVSRKDNIYTVQVDVDEIEGKPKSPASK